MALKRPVTLAQARQWPAAAKRRESFCARMGGMRKKRTSQDAAGDPGSPINRALAAWDCDKPEGLRREHVSKGVRMARGITPAMVGSAAKKKAAPKKKNPAARRWLVMPRTGRSYVVGSFSTEEIAKRYIQTLNAPWNYKVQREAAPRPIRKPAPKANPARPKLARIMITDDKTGEKRVEMVPYDFAIKAYIGPYQHDFFVRSEGATLVVSEKSTGLRVGAVPYMKRYATMNDRAAAKAFLEDTVQRVGADKFRAAIAKAPKIA